MTTYPKTMFKLDIDDPKLADGIARLGGYCANNEDTWRAFARVLRLLGCTVKEDGTWTIIKRQPRQD
jgi:hypothetical protein